MPILELEDGTMLSQSAPILNYVGRKYNLVPTDAMDLWKGESFVNYTFEDVFMKVGPALFSKDEDRAEKSRSSLRNTLFHGWLYLPLDWKRLNSFAVKLCRSTICQLLVFSATWSPTQPPKMPNTGKPSGQLPQLE